MAEATYCSPSRTARSTETRGVGIELTRVGDPADDSLSSVSAGPLAFDLVCATVGRREELERFLESLERQTHRAFRLILVDQNGDDRLEALLAGHPGLDIVRLRSPAGLSRARNAALEHVRAELVAFPDDDCVYPPRLLEQVARRFAAHPDLDGLTGRLVAEDGSSSPSWAGEPALLERDTVWNRAASGTTFLRRRAVERVGRFDEELGLGSGRPWSSGEEIDYLIRALGSGLRVEYDPGLTVVHERRERSPADLEAVGYRDGASVGYLLRKHRYRVRTVARMLLRPAGGVVLALARGDRARARFHGATLRGRLAGYLGDTR